MLIPLEELISRHGLDIDGVLHLGAHTGEEAEAYRRNGVGEVFWVEGNPKLMSVLTEHLRPFPEQYAFNALVADETGKEITFHISSNDTTPAHAVDHQSSSILELGTHLQSSPNVYFSEDIICASTTVDDLVAEHGIREFNFINLDLQGAELLALKGATFHLDWVDYIYTEINEREVYVGCVLIGDLDAFLAEWGFSRVETAWAGSAGWGDALYVKGR